MDIWTIALSLIGSIIGGTITQVGNCYTNKKKYQREYYQKIIDKRLNAYDNVQALLYFMDKVYLVRLDDGAYHLHEIFTGDKLKELNYKLEVTYSDTLWLSKDILDILRRITYLLRGINLYVVGQDNSLLISYMKEHKNLKEHPLEITVDMSVILDNSMLSLTTLGRIFYPELKELIKWARETLYCELKDVYDVEGFIDKAKKHSQ